MYLIDRLIFCLLFLVKKPVTFLVCGFFIGGLAAHNIPQVDGLMGRISEGVSNYGVQELVDGPQSAEEVISQLHQEGMK
ncbi:MAG: hypothetical protein C9356_15740 [Oleiphilus sp.]|nr:MAG: hypothetical protein C9356_15740 [Oleiphilus sp.]